MKKLFEKQNRGFTHTPKFGVTPKGGGFTLVETLVGLLIFTMSILALMSVLGSSIVDTRYAKQKIVAGYLAQEGIENMRNERDNYVLYNAGGSQVGWDEFKTADISYPTDFSGYVRENTMSPVAGTNDEVKISSKVSWTQGSGNYNITFSENLYNWVE